MNTCPWGDKMNIKKGIKIKRIPIQVKIYKLQKKKEGDDMNNNIKRPFTPAQSLEESLKEVRLMRDGQKKKRTWREYRNDVRSNTDR